MLVLKGLALMLTQSRKKEVDEFPIIFSYLIQQIWSCYSLSVLFSPHTMKKYKITAQTSIKTSLVLELGSAWNLAAEQFPELTVKKKLFSRLNVCFFSSLWTFFVWLFQQPGKQPLQSSKSVSLSIHATELQQYSCAVLLWCRASQGHSWSFLNKHLANACRRGDAFDEFLSVSLLRSEAGTSVMCCDSPIRHIEYSDLSKHLAARRRPWFLTANRNIWPLVFMIEITKLSLIML